MDFCRGHLRQADTVIFLWQCSETDIIKSCRHSPHNFVPQLCLPGARNTPDTQMEHAGVITEVDNSIVPLARSEMVALLWLVFLFWKKKNKQTKLFKISREDLRMMKVWDGALFSRTDCSSACGTVLIEHRFPTGSHLSKQREAFVTLVFWSCWDVWTGRTRFLSPQTLKTQGWNSN